MAKRSIYVMDLNIHHLVPTELQVVASHPHPHLSLNQDHNRTVVSHLILRDINVVNLNIGVGQVTTLTAVGVSVLKWLKQDTRQQA